jgi:plastocyanin
MKHLTRHRALCGLALAQLCLFGTAHAAPQQIMVINESGQGVAQAVVSVMVKGVQTNGAGTVVDMAQRDKRFAPSVVALQVGGSVNFPNFDTVRHHVYSFSNTRKFEIKLYTGTPTAPVVFDKPGTATLGCNIHDSMVGYVHVVETPYYGITDTSGKVTIEMPAGEHKARIWTPAMGEATLPNESLFKTGSPLTFTVKR